MLKKNTAGQFIYFGLVNATDGSAHTGQTPTGYVAIDAAGQGAIGGSIAELANGQYKLVLSQGDTNGDELGFFVVNSGSIPVSITVTTETKKMADLQDIAAGAAMNLAADAIKAVSYDESTAFPLAQADATTSAVARVGADGDTLETISDQLDAVPDAAAINAQVDLALTDIHLDHLLGVDFDSAAPVGNATSFLRQMVENDAGTLRYTTNALEQGPSGSGGDATEAKQDEILVDLVDIKGTAFAKDTNSLVDLAKITDIPDAAAIKSECDDALTDIHLDHLLAATYDPASKPGAADALLNELIESDGGVSRYTENALEQAPSGTGGDATAANQVLLLEDLVDIKGTAFVKDTHSLVDGALAADLATTDGKVDTIDANVVLVLEDTGTTLDGKLDTVITAVNTTLDGKIDTIDGLVDTIKDILEGDEKVDTATTPWQRLVRKNTDVDWLTPLVQQDLFDEAGGNVVATDDIIGQQITP